MSSPAASLRHAPWFVLGLAVLPHLSSLAAGFTYDDIDFVIRNQSIRTLAGAFDAFVAPFPAGDPARGLFRPLTNLSYAVDHALAGGLEPLVFHLTNVVLYGALGVLVLRLVQRHLGGSSSLPAFLAAALWAVHPVHCEAVDSVAGRSELLALLGILAALDLAPRSAALATLACAGAMLSKESGVVAPGLVGLQALVLPGALPKGGAAREIGRRLLPVLPAFLLLPAYFWLRFQALGRLTPAATMLADLSPGQRLLTVGAVHLENLRLLVWPGVLQPDYYYQEAVGEQLAPTAGNVLGLAIVGITVLVIVGGAWFTLTADRPGWRAVTLGLGFWAIALLPTSHLIPFGALMAERFLLTPSVGVAVVLAAGLVRVERQAWLAPVAALVGVALTARTAARVTEWSDGVRLWESLVAVLPDDDRAWNNYGQALLQEEAYGEAEEAFRKALTVNPGLLEARGNLADLARRRGDLSGAETMLRALAADHPEEPAVWNNLGMVLVEQGRRDEARACFEEALRRNPNHAAAARNLANLGAGPP